MSNEPREIKVIRKPRQSRLADIQPQFPTLPLSMLFLDYIEDKAKLKKNLPVLKLEKAKKESLSKDAFDNRSEKSGKSNRSEDDREFEERIRSDGEQSVRSERSERSVRSEKSVKSDRSERGDRSSRGERVDRLHMLMDSDSDGGDSDYSPKIKYDDKDRDIKLAASDSESTDDSDETDTDESDTSSSAGGSGQKKDSPPEEEEEDPVVKEFREKSEMIMKFRIMKRSYPNHEVIIPTEHDDLNIMKQMYNDTLREISFDENVEYYKGIMKILFPVAEYVCTEHIGIDMKGFAASQMEQMNKYDRLLLELGEKHQSRWGSDLPVEVRLMGMILFQAAIFWVGKKVGSTKVAEGIFNAMKPAPPTGAGAPAPAGGAPPPPQGAPLQPQTKMRGPSKAFQ